MFEKLIEYKEMREAIQRVRELAKSYDVSGDQTLWRVGQDIYEALQQGKK
jgi:hypothetical protein